MYCLHVTVLLMYMQVITTYDNSPIPSHEDDNFEDNKLSSERQV